MQPNCTHNKVAYHSVARYSKIKNNKKLPRFLSLFTSFDKPMTIPSNEFCNYDAKYLAEMQGNFNFSLGKIVPWQVAAAIAKDV